MSLVPNDYSIELLLGPARAPIQDIHPDVVSAVPLHVAPPEGVHVYEDRRVPIGKCADHLVPLIGQIGIGVHEEVDVGIRTRSTLGAGTREDHSPNGPRASQESDELRRSGDGLRFHKRIIPDRARQDRGDELATGPLPGRLML